MLPLMAKFRQARAELILTQFPDISKKTVLDLGGSTHFWNTVYNRLRPKKLTIMNISHDGSSVSHSRGDDRFDIELYDGNDVPASDREYDIVICNSVIEHVPKDARKKLSDEIRRVGKAYLVQTPAHEFPIEPHFLAPVIHWLPRGLARGLAPFTPYGLMHRQTNMGQMFDEIELLKRADFERLFPDGTLHIESFAGLPKSYVITGRLA